MIMTILCTDYPQITQEFKRMPRRIHIHDRECENDALRCQVLEWFAKGNLPSIDQVVDTVRRVKHFINASSNEQIQNLNLVGIPWKRESATNFPPKICRDDRGVPKWIYPESDELMEDNYEPSMAVIGSECIPAEDEKEESPAAMAAYVKGSLEVGKELYDECVRVVKRKRRIDEQYRTKMAKCVVGEELFGETGVSSREKRKISLEWQEQVDAWKESKRVCRKHYEGWRMEECMRCIRRDHEEYQRRRYRGMRILDADEGGSSSSDSEDGDRDDVDGDGYGNNPSNGSVDDGNSRSNGEGGRGDSDDGTNDSTTANPPSGSEGEVDDVSVKVESPGEDEGDEVVDDVDVKVFPGGEECECGCCGESSSHDDDDDDADGGDDGGEPDIIWM